MLLPGREEQEQEQEEARGRAEEVRGDNRQCVSWSLVYASVIRTDINSLK